MTAAPRTPRELATLAGLDLEAVTSPAIAVALDAIYAVPNPTTIALKVWRSVTPRRGIFGATWPTTRKRRIAAAIGRRGLKTSGLLAWTAVHELLFGGHEAYAAPGSRIAALVVAPRIAQSREAVRGIRGVLDMLVTIGVRYEQRDPSGATELVILSPASRVEKVVSVQAADAISVRSHAYCCVCFDEAGFLPSESWLAQTGEDIARAVEPGTATFPNARVLFTSSCGPPAGIFHRLVEKTPADTLVIRSSTWAMNPRVTKATCERLSHGDQAVLDQEYASKRWGYSGEAFVNASGLVLGDAYTDLGPRKGHFVIGLDYAPLRDATAIVIASGFDVEVNAENAPVRHIVCERVEVIESSRANPTAVELVAQRVASLSASYGDAPVLFDAYFAPEMKRALSKFGFREDTSGKPVPKRRTFRQVSMAPQDQTPRWLLTKTLAEGGRLHIGRDGAELVKQIGQLRATQQSSGSLKIDGKRDDAADAANLAFSVAVHLPPTGGPGGAVTFRHDGATWGDQGVSLIRPRWVRVVNGREVMAETPSWHPSFAAYAREMLGSGQTTPAIERWQREQQEQERSRGGRAVNTRVHD
jgi:hypothetical protein